jgi:formate hydrogenlyase subunit 3/multisubunit Na+/H+ antiporter MnhD subunit
VSISETLGIIRWCQNTRAFNKIAIIAFIVVGVIFVFSGAWTVSYYAARNAIYDVESGVTLEDVRNAVGTKDVPNWLFLILGLIWFYTWFLTYPGLLKEDEDEQGDEPKDD